MKKCIFLGLSLIVFSNHIFSQTNIFGSLKNKEEKTPVQNAVVALLTPKDSILYKFTRTNTEGKYSFKNVKEGNYILMTSHPYFADYLDNIEVNGSQLNMPELDIFSKAKLLQEVIVKSGSPIKIKGDTTIYTADSFKVSANANVEELLRKLPGIQVDKDGKIKAMGETVEKVLVDGEEFFGDDPGMAVKNLRADAIKEVQVFDKKSDQAEFTGIDDGNTKKTINLKLKEDKKKGYFGKIGLSGGLYKENNNLYNNNIMLSSFKGKRKISGFVLNGNTGQDGLSWEDRDKYGGGDNDNFNVTMDEESGSVMYSWNGGGVDDEPYVSTENGFIKNINAGIQYNNKFHDDKHTLNVSPKYNSQIYENDKTAFTKTTFGDSILNSNSNTSDYVNRFNVKTKASYDMKLDSNNTLKITGGANFYKTKSNELTNTTTNGTFGTLKNSTDKQVTTNNDKQAWSATLLFKHKFKKARRTLSFSTDWDLLNSNGENYLNSINKIYGTTVSTAAVNQQINNDKSSQKVNAKLIYTEPLSKKYAMELGYEIAYQNGKNNQQTNAFSATSQKYDLAVDTLTNNFNQNILVNKPSLKFKYTGKKLKVSMGSGFGFTHFNLDDLTQQHSYIRNYTNFFPQANINYAYKSSHNLTFSYNGNTTQPTINQLQPLRNNQNQFNQYIGNPALKPSFTNSISIGHNSYNFIKDIWTYFNIQFRQVSNSIGNNVVINNITGATTTQPINTNGNESFNIYGGGGSKFKKINVRYNVQFHASYNRNENVLNGQKNITKSLTPGFNIWLSKEKEKKYEFSLSNDLNYVYSKSSLNKANTHFITNTFSPSAKIYYKKTWSLVTDCDFTFNQKTSAFDKNFNTQIWNAQIQKTFKKDVFTFYFKVKDILNKNTGLDRNVTDNTYSETRNQRLRRYGLVGFTWNFKNKTATKK